MFYRLLVLAHFFCLATAAYAAPKVEPGKLKFCSSLSFETCSDNVDPSKPMYMWFEFAKPVGVVFQETFGSATMPSNGHYLVFVSKNIDTDPIVQYAGTILVNRWNQLNSFVLTAQTDDATMNALERGSGDAGKLPQPALAQMAEVGFRDQFLEGMAMQEDGTKTWEVFLFFKPWNGDVTPKEVFRGKFQYTLSPDNRAKLASYMNPDSRAKFGKEPDDGMKTALHEANAGKIVFSAKKLAADNEATGALATAFKSLDGLNARLYLKQSIRNTLATIGWGKDVGTKPYAITFSVDGKEFRTTSQKLDGDVARKRTTWSVTLAPSTKEEEGDNPVILHKFAYVISTLTPGKHELKLDAYVGGKGSQRLALASGSFTLDLTAAKRDAFAKAHGQQLPAKGSMDKALYTQLKALVPANVVTLRTPKVWEDRYDDFKRLTHRVTILVTGFKDEAGECKMATRMIEQPRTANGWGPAQFSSREKHWFEIDPDLPCQNLVKD